MENIILGYAKDAPDAVAVLDQGRPLTYAELVSEANHLSAQLKAATDPGSTIGILLGPGVEQVVAQVAVRLADGVCVPIEPSIRERRLADMLQDAQVTHIIMEDHQLGLPGFHRIDVGSWSPPACSQLPEPLGRHHCRTQSSSLHVGLDWSTQARPDPSRRDPPPGDPDASDPPGWGGPSGVVQ
ncbi:hypothetical protein ASPCADRAFT_205678 [Aspergillus carbonarius ITEM 5010]|uniref:AMP-dependent synthetase/ligase domain-containing protein n=1 Tax=Aspergillus carbonarius (strain ITEM 5010) TaxID=602072 RepID=A0A1R3RVF9_ASPC5|nr:hypothetical protein ASPCADRAFT_205678 [Aspergillus carbonarius ITEM 5010]